MCDHQPGCLADWLLIGLGQPRQINPQARLLGTKNRQLKSSKAVPFAHSTVTIMSDPRPLASC